MDDVQKIEGAFRGGVMSEAIEAIEAILQFFNKLEERLPKPEPRFMNAAEFEKEEEENTARLEELIDYTKAYCDMVLSRKDYTYTDKRDILTDFFERNAKMIKSNGGVIGWKK